MIGVQVTYDVNLKGDYDAMFKGIKQAMDIVADRIYTEVEINLHGMVLSTHTGKLAASIKKEVAVSSDHITVSVFSEGVPYAGILEEGGHTSPHKIVPKNSLVLAFGYGGNIASAIMAGLKESLNPVSRNKIKKSFGHGTENTGYSEKVNHPGSKFHPFMYLELALERVEFEISPLIEEAIEQSLVADATAKESK